MNRIKLISLSIAGLLYFANSLSAEGLISGKANETNESSKLVVLWTSGDREVALKMVFMYAYNAKKNNWWDEIRFIVWGPSSKLLSEDTELQEYIRKMISEGVDVQACKACADSYGVTGKLEDLGIPVKYLGKPLTDLLKSGWISITF